MGNQSKASILGRVAYASSDRDTNKFNLKQSIRMADWRNRMEQITNKVKHQLNAKGVDSISQLRGVFDQFDANQNGVLDKLEFEEMMSKLGVFLTRQEHRVVF